MTIQWLDLEDQQFGSRRSAALETGCSISITKARSSYSKKSKVTYHYKTCIRIRLSLADADNIGFHADDMVKIGYDPDENLFAIQKVENGDRMIRPYETGKGKTKKLVGIIVYWYPEEGMPFYNYQRKIYSTPAKWNFGNHTLTVQLPSSI